jgi:hypothetical protein
MNYQGWTPWPENGELEADFNDYAFQTVRLEDHLTIKTLSGSRTPVAVLAAGGTAEIRNISLRIVGDTFSARNLFFDPLIKFIGDKPLSVAPNAIGVLSLTSFGPSETDTVAAWGQEPFSQPYYYPVVSPEQLILNTGYRGLWQYAPYTGIYDITYSGSGCFLDYPSGMVNGQTIEIMMRPYDVNSAISFSTKYKFSENYRCGFCNSGLNHSLESGAGPIWTGWVGDPFRSGWFGPNNMLTDGLLVKKVSGLSTGTREAAGFAGEPSLPNTGVDLLTVKNVNNNYLATIHYRYI